MNNSANKSYEGCTCKKSVIFYGWCLTCLKAKLGNQEIPITERKIKEALK